MCIRDSPIIIALFLSICLSAQESVSNRFQEAENTENTAAEAPENPHEAVLKAVSYTHLDVYKRQQENLRNWNALTLNPRQMISLTIKMISCIRAVSEKYCSISAIPPIGAEPTP